MKSMSSDVALRCKPQMEVHNRVAAFSCGARFVNPNTGVPDLAYWIPDPKSRANAIASVMGRAGREMPVGNEQRLKHFERFAKEFIRVNLAQITDEDVPNAETWLAESGYPGKRKRQLLALVPRARRVTRAYIKNKSFIKVEEYGKAKCPRAINSYTDESKVILGPLVHAIDKAIFHGSRISKFFVKGRNPREWPRMLREAFGDQPVMMTDYTSFEAHHQGVFSRVVHDAFMHICHNVTDAPRKRLLSRMLKDCVNVCEFKGVTAKMRGRLMSGALWTSSGNGLLNLILASYIVGCMRLPLASPEECARQVPHYFVGFLEGDDGICQTGPVDGRIFDELGILLKFEYHRSYNRGSFCGVLTQEDSDDLLTDPVKVLRQFGYLHMKYARSKDHICRALVRAKALSLNHMYANCPIVGPLTYDVIRKTRNLDARSVIAEFDLYHAARLRDAIKSGVRVPDVCAASRLVVEEEFGIPVHLQESIEECIRRSDDLTYEIDLSFLANHGERDHVANYHIDGIEYYNGICPLYNHHVTAAFGGVDSIDCFRTRDVNVDVEQRGGTSEDQACTALV